MTEAGWIPVIERLPDNAECVLVSFSNYHIPATGRFTRRFIGHSDGAWYPDVACPL